MTYPTREMEGAWEEASANGGEFAGKCVRLLVLADDSDEPQQATIRHGAPVQDVAAVLASLPDLGDDADALWESIAENRRMRRTLAENEN